MPLSVSFCRDWEEFGEKDLSAYFENAYALFLERLDIFRRLPRPLNAEEEKELRFMFDALIEAKEFFRWFPAGIGQALDRK